MSTSGEDSDQRKKSNKIDKELEEDSKRLRKECKILLLGTSPPPVGALESLRRTLTSRHQARARAASRRS